MSAVPKGSMRAAHGRQVRAELLRNADFARCNRNRRQNLLRLVDALGSCLHFESMTSRPGWKYLGEQLRVHRATVGRLLAKLQEWGFLGVVASGRQAEHAPAGADGQSVNEAAVYVLCVPSRMAVAEEVGIDHVEEIATLSAVGGNHLEKEELTHTRARETDSNAGATPRLTIQGAASGAPLPRTAYRPELSWPGTATTSSRDQRYAAASELRERVFLLRPMSIKDIRSVCREFFLAGWTVRDIKDALDWLPDGSRHPNSGIPVTKEPWRLRGWLTARLAHYRTQDGIVMASPSQRVTAENTELRIRRQIQLRNRLERQAVHAARMSGGDSPAKITALARIRAMFDETR